MKESNMKRLRLKAGLSQSQLAEISGVNVRMVQYYEQGASDINKIALIKGLALADALGCEPKDLIEK